MSAIKETPVPSPNAPPPAIVEEYTPPVEKPSALQTYLSKKAEGEKNAGSKNKGGGKAGAAKASVAAAPAEKAADIAASPVGDSAPAEGVSTDAATESDTPGDVEEVAGSPIVDGDEATGKEPEAPKDPKAEARARRLQKVLDETLEKERVFHQQRQKHNAEIQAARHEIEQVKAQLAPYVEEVRKFIQLKERAKVDPKGVIEFLGLDMRQAIQQDLNGGEPTAEQQLAYMKEQLERDRAERAAEKQREEQRRQEYMAQMQAQQQQQLISSQQQRVVNMIEEHKDQFPLLAQTKRYGAVWQTMVRHMNEGNGLLPPLQAARYVEETLRERISKDATELRPVLEQMGIWKQPEVSEPATTPSVTAKTGPTLTNKNATPSTTKVGRQPVPPKETALERAAAIYRQRKK